ncbi:putative transporter SVOPL [Apostichopus japonicus]|uniref:Putative transporter SVOPL n=1 Tax=Stichopus japonicus TaxID=307972 RepID=A0A2G8K2Y9_STIJA|nr:putative transporter SVOPL [Apostichopus japonicus]
MDNHSPTAKSNFSGGLTPIPTRVWPRKYNLDGECSGEGTSDELLYEDFEMPAFKVDDAIQKIEFGLFHCVVVTAVFFSRVVYSSHIALAVLIIPTIRIELSWNRYECLAMQCAIFCGCLTGAIPLGKMSDKYGRKATAIFGIIFTLVCAAGSTFCQRTLVIIPLKFLEGFFIQGVVIFPVYLTEVLATEYRSVSNTICQIGLAIGYSSTGLMAYYLLPEFGWRGLTGLVCTIGVMNFIMIVILPSSPRQLALIGDNVKAYSSLRYIFKLNGGKMQNGALRDIGRIPRARMGEVRSVFRDRCASHLSIVIWIGRYLTQFAVIGAQLGGSILLFNPFYTKDTLGSLTFTMFHPRNGSSSFAHNITELQVFSLGAAGELAGSMVIVPMIRCFGVKQNLFLTTSIYTVVSIYVVTGVLLQQRWLVIACSVVSSAVARASANLMVVYTTDAYPTQFRATAFSVSEMFVSLAVVSGFLLSELLSANNFILELCFFSTSSFITSMSLAFLPIETKQRPIEET